MINKDEVDASTSNEEYNERLFGKEQSYHLIEYKKSPFIIYKDFFPHSVCNEIIKHAEKFHYESFNDGKSRYDLIDLRKRYKAKLNKWITNPLDKLIKDANNKNFLIDISQIEHISMLKFDEGDFIDWHHDCDWWENPYPYDKKLSLYVELSDSAFIGSEFEEFMSTVPIPSDFLTRGSVVIFPSYYYYKINPLITGTRKLLFLNVIGPKYK